MKADKLIDDANELLMQLRIKSEKERINEKQLYDVQMLLYKALDKLRQPIVSGELCPRCNSPLIYKKQYTEGYSCNSCFHDWA